MPKSQQDYGVFFCVVPPSKHSRRTICKLTRMALTFVALSAVNHTLSSSLLRREVAEDFPDHPHERTDYCEQSLTLRLAPNAFLN
eukprot:5223227-Amphidinium_carterae.1